ncbi:MAG TPA: DinB family protein [Candidatus Binataceae bacterium]
MAEPLKPGRNSETCAAESSSHLKQFRLMGEYNAWSDLRLYEIAGSLSEGERTRDLGAFFHSIHRTLNHLLLTDRHWMSRFAENTPLRFRAYHGAKLEPVLGEHGRELYSDFAELRREREATDAVLNAWLAELTPAMLDASMRYRNSQGLERVHPLWFAMAHFFNHQTHHRSQATTMLQQLGRDYGVTDFLVMYHLAPAAFAAR